MNGISLIVFLLCVLITIEWILIEIFCFSPVCVIDYMNDFYQFSPVWKLQLIWFLSLLKSVYIRLLQYVFQKCINFYIFLATSLIIIKGALLMYFCLWHHLRLSSRWYVVPSLWLSFYFPLVLFHTILLKYDLIFSYSLLSVYSITAYL